jgi:hypothetical protein
VVIPEYDWKSRKQAGAASNFDVQPAPGVEPPVLAVEGGESKSFTNGQHSSSSGGGGRDDKRGDRGGGSSSGSGSGGRSDASTRHARRLYVGNIPRGAQAAEVEDFFNSTYSIILSPSFLPFLVCDVSLSLYIYNLSVCIL